MSEPPMSDPAFETQTVEDRLRKYCGGVGLEAASVITALRAEVEQLREALQTILGGQKSAAGTWTEMVEPLVARFDVAANFGGDAVHNSEGSAAIAELLREMSARLDRSVNVARTALTQAKDTTND